MSDLMLGNVVTPPKALPYPETENEFLNAIMQNTGGYSGGSSSGGVGSSSGPASVNVNGFLIPRFDSIVFDYYDAGSTNIYHQYFKLNGTTVGTLTSRVSTRTTSPSPTSSPDEFVCC